MKGLGTAAAAAAAIILSGAGGAAAADLGTMAVKAPPIGGPALCTSILDFFSTACQLSGYGVRFYGAVDVGGAYQTHGTPMDKTIGTDYMLGKPSRGSMFVLAPSALSLSNFGLQIKEPLMGGWSFVGQVETSFNPYSFKLMDAPASLRTGIGVPLAQQNAITDANMNGQFYNDLGFAGFSHPVWGTLTYGRQNSLGADEVISYDPQQSAAGFSPLGLIGSWAGGGNTENRRDTSALKYRVAFANWHFGLYAGLGGYEMGNADTQAYGANVGADWAVGPGKLSVDVTGSWHQNSVSEGPGGIVGPVDINGNPISPFTNTNEFMSVSINDTTQVMAAAKYQMDRLKLYVGYDLEAFSSPDGTVPTCFTDMSGLTVGGACTGNTVRINTSLLNGRVFQMAWVGARYSLTDSLDLSGAYYHTWQNDWSHGALQNTASPNPANWGTCAAHPSIALPCAGTQDIVSAVLDWKFAPKWDTYIGTEYTTQNGGLVSGYLQHDNWSTTGGIRFRW